MSKGNEIDYAGLSLDQLYELTPILWGKFVRKVENADGEAEETPPNSEPFHRLEHHCADVAACMEKLLEDSVPHQRLAYAAGRAGLCEVTISRLAVIAFLHDIGKINCGFQIKKADLKSDVSKLPYEAGHITESYHIFKRGPFKDAVGFDQLAKWWINDGFTELLLASFSHHGRPETFKNPSGSDERGGPDQLWRSYDNYDPLAAAHLLGRLIRKWFPKAFEQADPLPASSQFVHFFAGIMVTADQIGSDTRFFKFHSSPCPDYINKAREIAAEAIRSAHYQRSGWSKNLLTEDPQQLFGFDSLRPLQAAVDNSSLDARLQILESETGSGKTEAALIRFINLFRAGRVDGLYFALPTRAAAKQIHERINQALKNLFPANMNIEATLAIPSYPQVGDASVVRGYFAAKDRFRFCWDDHPEEERLFSRWSSESVRHFLSAPVAVGTIDQALFSALQTKWAHLRGSGLLRSLLVVDEVHASDTYMTEILRQLVKTHMAAGGYALLMSATLGSNARSQLAQAHNTLVTPPEFDDACQYAYPVLTEISVSKSGPDLSSNSKICPIPSNKMEKAVDISARPIMKDAAAIAALAMDSARKGARVLVIRNTVGTAQKLLEELIKLDGKDLLFNINGVTTLHHSRFAVEDRTMLDLRVVDYLGKGRKNTGAGCVVLGTQTLEQSLDIDADLLITDLCPADILLQRIGRLHRHSRINRPEGFKSPVCVVLSPENGLDAGLGGQLSKYGLGFANKAASNGVYPNLLSLQATLGSILDHPQWLIPAANRELTENATHDIKLREMAERLGDEWIAHYGALYGNKCAAKQTARAILCDWSEKFSEQRTGGHETAHSRLGIPSYKAKLAKDTRGPFGNDVRTFNIPAYLLDKLRPDEEKDDAGQGGEKNLDWLERIETEANNGVLVLKIGNGSLEYDHLGLRKPAS